MSDKIPPALSEEEWSERHPEWGVRPTMEIVRELVDALLRDGRPAAAIAVLNKSLGDDCRKITREIVQSVRDAAELIGGVYDSADSTEERKPWVQQLNRFADALESYLPPEKAASAPGPVGSRYNGGMTFKGGKRDGKPMPFAIGELMPHRIPVEDEQGEYVWDGESPFYEWTLASRRP